MPDIRTLLDLSTAHLPEQICDRLDTIPGVIAHQTAYGWLIFVPNHPGQRQLMPPPTPRHHTVLDPLPHQAVPIRLDPGIRARGKHRGA